jgi:Tfp pilus assembly protein PilX
LVIVMLVMAVLLMAGTTFLTISSTESQIASNEQASVAAQGLAEAAIHKYLTLLNAGSTYAGETNRALGGGTFTITVTTVAGCTSTSARQIVATGSVPVRGGLAQVQLRVTVDTVAYPYRWATFATIPNQIISSLYDPISGENVDRTDSELWLGNNDTVDSFDSGAGTYDSAANSGLNGNVGANGDVNIGHDATMDGRVQAGDDAFLGPGVTVTGGDPATGLSPNSTDPGVPFPSVTASGAHPTSGVAPASYVTSTGALNVPTGGTVTFSAGTYYLTNITMGDGARLATSGGTVTIYVTGPPVASTNKLADLGSNVTIGAHPGTQLQIIAKSDPSLVTLSDGSQTDFLTFAARDGLSLYGSIYGKNTDIYLGGNSQVYGSIIGRTVRLRHDSYIHYDQAMSNLALCHNGKFTIRRGTWREVIPST